MNLLIWLSCALINIAIAILHIYVIYKGPSAYRYFGAGEGMATKAEQGSLIPAVVTSGIVVVFFVFALYCLAAIDSSLLPLPWLFYALVGITVIFLLRGSLAVAFPFMKKEAFTDFERVSTYISLCVGILHGIGVYTYHLENLTV